MKRKNEVKQQLQPKSQKNIGVGNPRLRGSCLQRLYARTCINMQIHGHLAHNESFELVDTSKMETKGRNRTPTGFKGVLYNYFRPPRRHR